MERDGCDVVFDPLKNFNSSHPGSIEYTPAFLFRSK
jgi:hypothetical protein